MHWEQNSRRNCLQRGEIKPFVTKTPM